MKVPLSWLRSFVPVELALDELVDLMGANGLEVDGVTHPGAGTRDVRVARVLAWQPHPDADKLRVVQVDTGNGEVELVCGATNFDVGDLVAHAAPGSSIPGMTMAAKKLRGVLSNGMLCSARELQIGDDHDGIMRLDASLALGLDVAEVLPLGEPVIDVEVLADRGDHHSILGIARELSAILDLPLRMPPSPSTDVVGPVALEIEAPDACLQFATRTVGGVSIGIAPWAVRMRLAQCGVRSISNVVDVTNYVMLELGQPMHAYDLATIEGRALGVRMARPGEELTTLDGQERQLDPRDVLVVDGARPVGLAGVMGGLATEVSVTTTDVVFEAATWDPASVRATSLRLGMHSEAGMRFARRVDPSMALIACDRAVSLLGEMAPELIDLGANHVRGTAWPSASVTTDTQWVRDFIGLEALTNERQQELLERAGCNVTSEGDHLTVVAPSWRGDLLRPADVAEEIVRLHGYDQIPATLPHTGVLGGLTSEQKAERTLHATCLALGLDEVVTPPWVGEQNLEGLLPGDPAVVLSNPLSKDAGAMRTSLVEGLLSAVRRNVGQGRQGVAIYEYGRIFRRPGGTLDTSLAAFGDAWRWTDPASVALPTQPRTLAIALQGRRSGPGWLDTDEGASVYDVLAVLDRVVEAVGPPRWAGRLERRSVSREGFHPGRAATLHLDGHEVGFVGQLHPVEGEGRDLPEPIIVGELLVEPLLDDLARGERGPRQGSTLIRHPAMTLDVALVAQESIPYEMLAEAVRRAAGDLLDGLWWFDEYRGEQVGVGHRSVAIRLRLQAPDRQLTDDDKASVLAAIASGVEGVGAALRT